MDVCQSCGNDDATHQLCTDYLSPSPYTIAVVVATVLGGQPDDYTLLADRIAATIGP